MQSPTTFRVAVRQCKSPIAWPRGRDQQRPPRGWTSRHHSSRPGSRRHSRRPRQRPVCNSGRQRGSTRTACWRRSCSASPQTYTLSAVLLAREGSAEAQLSPLDDCCEDPQLYPHGRQSTSARAACQCSLHPSSDANDFVLGFRDTLLWKFTLSTAPGRSTSSCLRESSKCKGVRLYSAILHAMACCRGRVSCCPRGQDINRGHRMVFIPNQRQAKLTQVLYTGERLGHALAYGYLSTLSIVLSGGASSCPEMKPSRPQSIAIAHALTNRRG